MKRTILWILLDSIFVILFNTIFFLSAGTVHPASVWISYAFIHIAYIMMLFTGMFAGNSSDSSTFAFAIGSVSATYFVLEFIVGLIFIFASPEGFKAALIIQLIMAGIYGIVLISNLLANDSTQGETQRHEVEIQYVKQCSARLKLIMDSAPDKETRKKIERAYDLIRTSQLRSNISVRDLEVAVINQIAELMQAMPSGDAANIDRIVSGIMTNANERNTRLMLLN